MQRHRRPPRPATALLLSLGLVMAGCGGGEEGAQREVRTTTSTAPEAPTPPPDDTPPPTVDQASGPEGFCDAVLVSLGSAGLEIDEEAAPVMADDQIRSALEVMRTDAPGSVTADVETLVDAFEAVAHEQDPADEPDPMATMRAQSSIVRATVDECGWQSLEAVGTEYAFEGVPDTLAPGPTVVQLANDGEELHQLSLLRRNEGVEESFEELLDLPEDERQDKLLLINEIGVTDQGETSAALAELEPGEYGIACHMPVGTTSLEAVRDPDEAPGPPHFTEGMVASFTVG